MQIREQLIEKSCTGGLYDFTCLLNTLNRRDLESLEQEFYNRILSNIINTQHMRSPQASVSGIHVFLYIAWPYLPRYALEHALTEFKKAGNDDGADIMMNYLDFYKISRVAMNS